MFTANDLHIIVRYCTSSFLDICWFLLTTDDLAHWLAVRYGVVSSLMQWIETTDVIPVDYSLNTPIIFCIIMWFLAIECSLVWFVECWHINDDDVEVNPFTVNWWLNFNWISFTYCVFLLLLKSSIAFVSEDVCVFPDVRDIGWVQGYHPKTVWWVHVRWNYVKLCPERRICLLNCNESFVCTEKLHQVQFLTTSIIITLFLWIGSIGPIYWHLFTPYNRYYYTMG